MTTRRTRVLLVGRGAPETGGIAAFLAGLDNANDAAFETVFLNLTHAGDMGDGGSFSRRNVARTWSDLVAVWRAAGDVDVVHIHSALAPSATLVRAGLLTIAARARRRPVVVHAHGGRLVSFAERARNRWLVRSCLGAATHVIAVSHGVARVLVEELGVSRVSLIPNGVDTDHFTPSSATDGGQPPQVVYVGHLSERKGVLDLLRASQTIRDEGVAHDLVLVGGRPDEGDDEHRRILGEIEAAQGAARMVGAVAYDDMPAIYRGADVFCLASWWEAMPLSILEAMSSGLPVVATDVGDVAMLVDHERTGLVVDPGSPDDLCGALTRVLSNSKRRREMGTAGRLRAVDEFSIAATHQQISDVYERLR